MSEATTSTATAANVSPLDQMAQLLMGDEPSKETQKEEVLDPGSKESEAVEDLTEDTTSNAEDEATETNDDSITWAEVLGVDDNSLFIDESGDFKGVNVKVNGVTSTVDLPTLIAGYQTNQSYTVKSQALAEERKTFETQKTQLASEYTKKLDVIDRLTEYLSDKIVGEYKNIDWQSLRVQNPGEYAAMVQDYNMRMGELGKVLQAVDSEKQSLTQQSNEQSRQQYNEYLRNQADMLIRNNPQWSDTKRLKEDFQKFETFVSDTYGFTAQEFASVQDARLVELLKDAYAYRQGIALGSKKLKDNAPKYQKPSGNGTPKQLSKLEKLTRAAKTSKGPQKQRAQIDAIAELLSG